MVTSRQGKGLETGNCPATSSVISSGSITTFKICFKKQNKTKTGRSLAIDKLQWPEKVLHLCFPAGPRKIAPLRLCGSNAAPLGERSPCLARSRFSAPNLLNLNALQDASGSTAAAFPVGSREQ